MKYKEILFCIKKFLARYGILILFLIFLSTTFVFFYGKSYNNQEIDYLKVSSWGIKKIIFDNYGDQLPLWFILVKFYTGVFGQSEISLKILSVGIFLLAAFVLYKICEIYSLNKYLITSLFLFNPLLLKEVAYIFKHWSFLILITLATLYFFEKFKKTQNKKYLFFFFLTIIVGIYSNLIFLIFLYALAIYLLINLISKQLTFKFFIFFLIICILSSVPLSYYYKKAENQLISVQGSHMDWGVSARGFNFIKESLAYISGVKDLNKYNILSGVLIFLFLMFFLLQFFLEKEKKFIYLKTWLALTVLFTLIIMMVMAGHTPVRSRYITLLVPFFYLGIFPKSKKFYVLVIAILLLSLTVFSSWQMTKNYHPDNWKGTASFLKPQIKENTQVLMLYEFNVGPLIMEYYLGEPVMRLYNLESPLILYSDDIWVVRRHGKYDAIYKITDKYNIEEYNNFEPIKLFHLTKKNPEKSNNLIFNNPLIEIENGKKSQKLQFSNGAIGAWNCQEDWQQIRINAIKSGGVEKICLFVHPRNNTKINLIYKNVKLSQAIKVLTGIADNMVIGNLSPVYMDVYIDNALVKQIIQPDEWGWLTTEIDTNQYKNKSAEVKFTIYTDDDPKRHFCFDAEITEANDYFYQNIKNAKASIENKPCPIYKTDSIWPHNEKRPPFSEAAIFERWDCEEDLVSKNRIWNTIGKSYAVSNNEFKEAIWMHPATNKVKSLKYENINLHISKITGFYGLNDYAISNKIEATLTFTIVANGKKIYEDKFTPTKGWKNFEIPFNKKLDNIIFSITTPNDRWNHFFFNTFLEE